MSTIQRSFVVFVLAVAPLAAHHAFSAEYDSNSPVTLSGTIQSVDWAGPHVVFNLKSDEGQVWSLEGANAATLNGRGYGNSMFAAGTRVTFEAYKAKSGAAMGSARAVTLADGRKISVSDSLEDGGPAPAALTTQTGALPQTGSDWPMVALIGVLAGAAAVSMGRGKRAVS